MDNNDHILVIYTGQPKEKIPRTVTHVTVDPSCERIEDHAFENCAHLAQVSLSTSVKVIGHSAFRKCTLLNSISIPSSLENIGDCAFESCDCLTSMDFPSCSENGSGLKSIGRRAFRWCQSLERVSIPHTVENIGTDAFHWCPLLMEVSLVSGLKTIGEGAFAHCVDLSSLQLPSTLAAVGMCAFHSCESLIHVDIAETKLEWTPYATFSKCCSLISITLPKTLKIIGKCTFFECKSLVDVRFEEGLKNIATKAFSECRALCGIDLPSTVETVGAEAFEFCTSLLCVSFPSNGHVKLGPHCFRGCESLVTISIPHTMDSVSNDTFIGCNLLWVDKSLEVLSDRFTHLPVHEICYHSSRAEDDDLVQAFDALELSCDGADLDVFGMTPLHVVATSVGTSTTILQALLDKYPSATILHKDNHGRTMMDYLLMHTSNRAVGLIQIVLQRFVSNRIAGWNLGSERNVELSSLVDAMQTNTTCLLSRREIVEEIFEHAGFCTMVEVTSLIEMAMWRMRMNNLQKELPNCKVDRSNCRYQCGADVVMLNVMKFLWKDRSDAAMSNFPLYSMEK